MPLAEDIGASVSHAVTGADCLAKLVDLRPDVAVIEPRLGGLDGFEVMREAKCEGIATRFLFIASEISSGTAYRAITLGADGIVTKGIKAIELAQGIKAVSAGQAFFSGDLIKLCLAEIDREAKSVPSGLTPREVEILGLMGDGLAPKQVALRLRLSVATVRTHTRKIREKLGVHSSAGAVAEGTRRGLLP